MARTRHIPERKCVACGLKAPKRLLTRIVRTPQGSILADASGKASGRGAYLCISPGCWDKAVRRGGLQRSLKVTLTAQDQQSLLEFYGDRVAQATSAEV